MLKVINKIIKKNYIHYDNEGYNTVLVNPIISAGIELNKSISEKIADTGNNTGNLLFVEGIKEQIYFEQELWVLDKINNNIKKPVAIMPSANFIINGSDNWILSCKKFLENNDCPITLAGLGAQSSKKLNTPKKLVEALTSTKKEYFKMVSERAVTIGVRGEFTAECLELMGIKNYRIIGCPSFFKYINGRYPKLQRPSLECTQMTVTTGNALESRILEMGIKLNSIWLMQMMTEMPKSAFENETISAIWVNRRFPDLRCSLEEYSKYLKEQSRIFFRLNDWNQYYKQENVKFAYGSRFHGNMAAIRNGVPALWIAHDSRTTELVKTLHLPYITIEKFAEIKNAEELLDYCDYSDMYKSYRSLCNNYVEFLEENHISHRFK